MSGLSFAAAPSEVSSQWSLEYAVALPSGCPGPASPDQWSLHFEDEAACIVSHRFEAIFDSGVFRAHVPASALTVAQGQHYAVRLRGPGGIAAVALPSGVYIDAPPMNGRIAMNPLEGIAASTWFAANQTDWEDDDLPLAFRYELYELSKLGVWSWSVLRGWMFAPNHGFLASIAGELSIRGFARDALGGVSATHFISANVSSAPEPAVNASSAEATQQLVASIMAGGAGSTEVIGAVSALALSSSSNNSGPAPIDEETASVLLGALGDALSGGAEPGGEPGEFTAVAGAALGDLVAGMGAKGSDPISATQASEAAGMLDALTEIMIGEGVPVPPKQLGSLSASAATLVSGARPGSGADGAATSGAVMSAISRVGTLAAASVEEGGAPLVISTGGLQISVAKPSPEGRDFTIENFQLPGGLVTQRRLQEENGDEAEVAVWVQHVTWGQSPFAFAGPGKMNVSVGIGSVQSMDVMSGANKVTVEDLREPVLFWIASPEDVSSYPGNQVIERGCVFWNESGHDWSTEGCWTVAEESNSTHVRCACNHLSSFTASAKKAYCKFCKVDINAFDLFEPASWFLFRADQPGLWVLVVLMLLLYMPCFILAWKDRDWKQMRKNKKAYFKDSALTSDGFECMLMPGFRVCMGLIMFAPVVVHCPPRCPPRCCSKKREKPSSTQLVDKALKAKQHRQAAQTTAALKLVRKLTMDLPVHEDHITADDKQPMLERVTTKASSRFEHILGIGGTHIRNPVVLRACYMLECEKAQHSNSQVSGTLKRLMADGLQDLIRRKVEQNVDPDAVGRGGNTASRPDPGSDDVVGQQDLSCATAQSAEISLRFTPIVSTPRGNKGVPSMKVILNFQAMIRGFLARRRVKLKRMCREGHGVLELLVQVFRVATLGQVDECIGSKEVFVPLDWLSDSTISGHRPMQVDLGQIRVEFRLAFMRQVCEGLPNGVLFGQLLLNSPKVTLTGLNLPKGSSLYLCFSPCMSKILRIAWNTFPILMPPSGIACWNSMKWFNLWHFSGKPLAQVKITSLDGNRQWCSFFLISEAPVQKHKLTVQPVVGPSIGWKSKPEDRQISDMIRTTTVDVVCRWSPAVVNSYQMVGRFSVDWVEWSGSLPSWETMPGCVVDFLVDTAPVCESNSQVYTFPVPPNGKVNSSVFVDIRPTDVFLDLDEAAREYFFKTPEHDADATMLAKRMQYHLWSREKILYVVGKRENPFFKCCPYSPMISRKMRYAMLSCGLLVATTIGCFLFRAPCLHLPKPAVCSKRPGATFPMKFFTWDMVFASMWGILLSTPLPLLLTNLWKKKAVLVRHTDEEKDRILSLWLCEERLGWLVVTCVHLVCILTISQFLRYYPWPLIEKWLGALWFSLLHRFVTAPGVRATWVLVLLFCTRLLGCCDSCLVTTPAATTFPAAVPKPPPFKPGQSRAQMLWARTRTTVLTGTLHRHVTAVRLLDEGGHGAMLMGYDGEEGLDAGDDMDDGDGLEMGDMGGD